MIAFGASITAPEVYARCAQPGVERAVEPDSVVLPMQASGSLARTYNLILERAGALPALEALVLLHQDAELVDPAFCARVRDAVAGGDVGLAGSIGATGGAGMGWWQGELAPSSSRYRYGELGGGEHGAAALGTRRPPGDAVRQDVDTLYGVVLVLSPWAVRTLRFDEGLDPRLGLDADLCRQVRAAGRRVVAADLRLVHHHALELIGAPEGWIQAHVRLAEKWEAAEQEPDWQARARRAEADAAAARLLVASRRLQADAIGVAEQERLRVLAHSGSWRLTAPLRRLAARVGPRA